jgi:hypothetical protein
MILPSIDSTLAILRNFESYPGIAECLDQLRILPKTEKVVLTEAATNNIRNKLANILTEKPEVDTVVSNHQILGNAIRHSLLALAVAAPLNPKDPILNAAIQADQQVVISSGHQFNLRALINWHNNREWFSEETQQQSKRLRNPITGEIMPDHDFLYIRAVAAEQGITFLPDDEPDINNWDMKTLLTPKQRLHPFVLELDRLSGNAATAFLKEKGYVHDGLQSILRLSPNTFHCASTPAIRELATTRYWVKTLLVLPTDKRLLFANPLIVKLVKQNASLGLLLNLDNTTVDRLLDVSQNLELMQFFIDQNWLIRDITSLGHKALDSLKSANVRKLFVNYRIQSPFYFTNWCSEDLISIADFLSLAQPIKDVDKLCKRASSYIGGRDIINDFQQKVLKIKNIKKQYQLGTEAACVFYNNSAQIMALMGSPDKKLESVLPYDIMRLITSFFSTPPLSPNALNDLEALPKNWKQYHRNKQMNA